MSAKATILCDSCSFLWLEEHKGEDIGVFLAAGGPTPDVDDESVLVCVPWHRRAPFFPSAKRQCAKCGADVAVAQSSLWLLGEHMIPPV